MEQVSNGILKYGEFYLLLNLLDNHLPEVLPDPCVHSSTRPAFRVTFSLPWDGQVTLHTSLHGCFLGLGPWMGCSEHGHCRASWTALQQTAYDLGRGDSQNSALLA